MFALSSLWISQFIGTMTQIFSRIFNLTQIIMFVIAVIILIFGNKFGLETPQHAYRVGQASHMVPIQNVPIIISPIFIYFLVFLMVPSFIFSIVYLIIGVALSMVSLILLGKRSAQLEGIK